MDLSTPFVKQVSFNSPDSGITPVFLLRNGQPAVPAGEPHTSAFGSVAIGKTPYSVRLLHSKTMSMVTPSSGISGFKSRSWAMP